ncbi:MAG: hypothetical protein P8I39_07145 [Akkermansiaceae bacterium]|jgi:hypothetical protein|nr:hypothetical protein [Akkermansiaceae bacterium]
MQMILLAVLGFCALVASAQDKPEIPDDLLDTEHFQSDSALNEFTVPSISKVFNELEKVSPLSYDPNHYKNYGRTPIDRSRIALRLGTLIADGFIAVQTGNSEDVPKIAAHISRYSKALGAGDKIKVHAAELLEHAKAKDLPKLKRALASTQRDVELELAGLRDPDLSHLISLGGWLEALDSAATAINKKYTPERALTLFREDVADYYAESIGSLHPDISRRPHLIKMRELLQGLRNAMVLKENSTPSAVQVKEVTTVSSQLVEIARR